MNLQVHPLNLQVQSMNKGITTEERTIGITNNNMRARNAPVVLLLMMYPLSLLSKRQQDSHDRLAVPLRAKQTHKLAPLSAAQPPTSRPWLGMV
jgi:hypothetical protein